MLDACITARRLQGSSIVNFLCSASKAQWTAVVPRSTALFFSPHSRMDQKKAHRGQSAYEMSRYLDASAQNFDNDETP